MFGYWLMGVGAPGCCVGEVLQVAAMQAHCAWVWRVWICNGEEGQGCTEQGW